MKLPNLPILHREELDESLHFVTVKRRALPLDRIFQRCDALTGFPELTLKFVLAVVHSFDWGWRNTTIVLASLRRHGPARLLQQLNFESAMPLLPMLNLGAQVADCKCHSFHFLGRVELTAEKLELILLLLQCVLEPVNFARCGVLNVAALGR